MTHWFAAVAVEGTAYHYDKAFDYAVPANMRVQPGARVKVPFGAGKPRVGVVLNLHNNPPAAKAKAITSVLDCAGAPATLPADLVALIPWLKETTFCTLYEAYCAMVPAGLRHQMHVLYCALPPDDCPPDSLLDERELMLVKKLRAARNPFTKREDLLKRCKLPADSTLPEQLAEKGYLLRQTDAVQQSQARAKTVYALADGELGQLTPKQQLVVDFLRENNAADMQELCGYCGVTSAVVTALVKRDVLLATTPSACGGHPSTEGNCSPPAKIHLTPAQQAAYENLRKSILPGGAPATPTPALLFGVTGSGKTSVYLKLIDDVLAQGKTALVLVPEIALTPQMLGIFTSRYGDDVVLLHSSRSVGERTQAWQRARNGQARIVLGTRSAVFAPLQNIGLIVLDEEHEHTYKSEQSPRYHARDVARARAKQHGALLLLSSATPAVESYAAAKAGRYQLEVLPGRYGSANLPEIRTVDLLSQENLLSRELLAALEEHIAAGRQAILLMNRRGFSTYLTCTGCKQVITCDQCSISLAYHMAGQRMLCHYCGHTRPAPEKCPGCGKLTMRFGGAGTQKLVDELARLLPNARVARMDADSTAQKHAREEILAQFAAHDFDILVGTQMVAKGLDFANVTLVGVVNIDQQLYFDDYRALERSFALLTQVAGRAGRGEHPGVAYIQTINPFNEVIMQAAQQDYPAFFDGEIRMRKLMTYPPYCDLCMLGVTGENEQLVKAGAKFLLDQVKQYPGEKLIVLGPMPARVSRVNKKYRWRLLLKCRNTATFRRMVSEILITFGKTGTFSEVTVWADMNAQDNA
ncbi:MAG: primosomal protein N' [Oscillospiraceae bacterium]|nr:primosomal protein N' [Oscillospiraceae bacterium]